MRGYWFKIGLKAFAIFAVGMLVITGFRSVKGKVNHAINSSDPIPIPIIGLVPFNLDNQKLGSVSRVEFLRSDPEHVSGVRVLVKLQDLGSTEVLSRCVLALDDIEHIDDRTTFRCAPSGESAEGLEHFGVVAVKNSADTFPLLLPARAVTRLRETTFSFRNGKVDISGPPSAQAMMVSRTDSLREELSSLIDAQTDSIDHLRELSTELEDSAAEAPRDKRRALQRSADSARAVMRNLVDRMKANEGRMHVLDKVSQMREMRRDWKPVDGVAFSDSVARFVNDELARVQAELQAQGITGLKLNVHLDSTTRAAMREGIERSRDARGQPATERGAPSVGVGAPAAPAAPVAPPKPAKVNKSAPAPKVEPTPQVEAAP